MTPLELADHLEARGFRLSVQDGHLIIAPASRLLDADRALILQHRDTLVALLTNDYSTLPDGWHRSPGLPSRVVRIQGGHLFDSVCFESEAAASDFLERLRQGEHPEEAMRNAGRTHPTLKAA
ncbi:hypothetical protein [Thiofaba sp. EF100]|uniref:hypothetical protein n=1 Tax=Thiofaba sp. EF100 TaxID=3121274 RepID=UPI0032218C2F